MWLWQDLVGNLAIVALFIASWRWIGDWLDDRPVWLRCLLFGVAVGVGAAVSMLFAVRIGDGVVFDLRMPFLSVGALFGGPISAIVSLAIAGLLRIWMGGVGTTLGLVLIASVSLFGVTSNLLVRRFGHPQFAIVANALFTGALVCAAFLVFPRMTGVPPLDVYWFPAVTVSVTTTLILNYIVRARLISSDARRLMHAAVLQSMDYQYIKDRNSRIVLANKNVSEYYGFADPSDMYGKTDFDLTDEAHAKELHAQEQRIMETGEPVRDHKEMLVIQDGTPRWFMTSKSPVLSGDGRVIGLIGITRDVTEHRQMVAELEYNRNMLSYALTEMSDGLAMFDENGTLVFCNDQFRFSFPGSVEAIKPGVHYRDIIRAVGRSGDEIGMPEDPDDDFMDNIFNSLSVGGGREIQRSDGRWLRMKGRATAEKTTIVTVTDVTEMKVAHEALVTLTGQLKSLAMTDGLTGLINRREFDVALHKALRQGDRSGSPVSVLLIDVDHFKSYNDIYGHLAGDDCLRALSRCFRQVARRPEDVIARYGGEEFVFILPDADAVGAEIVAEALRERLKDMALPHSGNEKGRVTVSIGIATCDAGDDRRSETELLRRADEALYAAKHAGRDRIAAWSADTEVKIAAAG